MTFTGVASSIQDKFPIACISGETVFSNRRCVQMDRTRLRQLSVMDVRNRRHPSDTEWTEDGLKRSGSNATAVDVVEEENRLPCCLVVGCLLATVVVFSICLYAAAYVPPSPSGSEELQWWQSSVIYQIYPRSFKDSNADGVGDIAGIISKLDYLSELGIGAIWIGPVYPSPQVDFGYDVTDHCAVDDIYGAIEDMERLIDETHRRGMRVILDFIPNHTSDKHPWFQSSRRHTKIAEDIRKQTKTAEDGRRQTNDNEDYRDFFIWSNGRRTTNNNNNIDNTSADPPNNWRSAFGGSAWSWDEERRQFYFHQFSRHQPDLSYRNPDVIQKMTDVLKFWIEKGVDGFRVDAADFLVESNELNLDEPLLRGDTTDRKEVDFRQLNHIYTQHQSETHEVFQLWRQFLNEYEQQTGKHIVLIAETFDNSTSMRWWKTFYENGAVDMPFNFYLMERTNEYCIGICFREVVETLVRNLPKDKWLNWVLGSHDQKRVSTKYGCLFGNVLNMLNLLLPGTAITYQGEEIGMEDIHRTYEETKDPLGKNAGPSLFKTVSRDGSRSPMQWSGAKNGGFTSGRETWLPVHPNYVINNVMMQQKDLMSTWWQYRRLVDLRRRPSFLWGQLDLLPQKTTNQDVFAFVRFPAGKIHPRYLVIANVGKEPSRSDFSGQNFGKTEIPRTGRIVHLSTTPSSSDSCPTVKSFDSNPSQFISNTKSSQYSIDELINLDHIILDIGEGLVIEFYAEQK